MKTIPALLLGLLTAGLAAAQSPKEPLKTGDTVPDIAFRTEDDKTVRLRDLVAEKPAVLIFYRGGWCPYCTRHLSAIEGVRKELEAAGAQLLAISPDQPSKLRETPKRDQIGYRLLSDSAADAAKGFGVAFRVDDSTVEKYKEYKIDLNAASGRDHRLLPHPAVFVVGTNGVIRFAHVNPDYTKRLEPAKLVEAARGARP